MNKKLILLIAGILLILAGLIGWYCFNKDNNLDEQVLEDIKLNENVGVNGVTEEVKIDSASDKNVSTEPKVSNKIDKTSKVNAPKLSNKVIINVSETENTESPLLEETISESKELTNPYVDSDGSIVVTDEFKQPIKQKVKYRGVVYNIKTKLLESQK